MLIPSEKLQQWAASVEPVAAQVIVKFLAEAESKMAAEIDAAKTCLKAYGFKVYEDQKHEYQQL